MGMNNVSLLLYADAIVLLSGSELKIQSTLQRLGEWCDRWSSVISETKTKLVHFRAKCIPRSETPFKCATINIEAVSQYKYLGLIFNEHLDFLVMVKMIAQSASRALGLLIAKDKSFGGMPFVCYTKCYDAIVQATLNYGAPVYGTNSYSCVEAIQNRACRYFLGLGKYAPNPAINGDMGWSMPQHKQWICVIRQWCKMLRMADSKLTKKIFNACLAQSHSKCRTWFHRVKQFLISIDHEYVYTGILFNTRSVLASVDAELKTVSAQKSREKLNTDTAVRGEAFGGNKLRTYRKLKQTYSTEQYVCVITHKRYRSAYAKFRCGVAPLKIETCRYGLNRLPVEQRLCEQCGVVEDEFHVLMVCAIFDDIRCKVLEDIGNITEGFSNLSLDEQFIQIMSNPQYFKIVSKAMYNILNKKRYIQFH